MNEKIKELISQSYEYAVVTTIDPFTQEVVTDYIDGTKPIFNKEKFAELIVRECADYANWYQANSRYTDIAKAIKDHFGVEL